MVTPAFSFVASATAALQLGARPVFVDIDPATFALDPDRVSAAITPRTRVILAVHLYGLPAAMGPLRVLAQEHGVHLVEDAAQAFGATLGGRPVGGHGRAAAFSFYPTKNLAAYGDAGLVTTTDAALAAHLRLARNHGQTQKYRHAELGWTARLDELQAAILRVKLRHLPAWTLARQAVAARYNDGLAGLPLVLPAERPGATHVFHQYTVRTHRRDALAAHLAAAGIGTACHYPLPIPAQPMFRDLGYDTELVSGGMGRRSGGALAPLLPPSFGPMRSTASSRRSEASSTETPDAGSDHGIHRIRREPSGRVSAGPWRRRGLRHAPLAQPPRERPASR